MKAIFVVLVALSLADVISSSAYDVSGADSAGNVLLQRQKRGADTRKSSFTFEEKKAILKRHNKHRGSADPTAANMELMYWSSALEKVAQTWANGCHYGHNSNRNEEQSEFKTVGENIFYTTGSVNDNTNKFVDWWYNEYKDYTFSTNKCADNKECTHYTQIMWHNTVAVGCGVKYCANPTGTNTKEITYVVCDYAPFGNIRGQKPYKEGKSCSDCPRNKTVCENNMCSAGQCAGRTCKHGGKLSEDVCMCDCSGTEYGGDTCEVGSGSKHIAGNMLLSVIGVVYLCLL